MLVCEHCQERHEDDQSLCPNTGKIFRPERIFPPGTVLEGKYRLERALGAGGMGAVFRAVHTMLNKQVAIKLTLPELAQQRELMTRMVREARAASATGHPNIAAVTDMGWTEAGGLFLVMEYLDGSTLGEVIAREGRVALARAADLVSQVLAGLAAVHQRGIVHRDLKPENVMVVRDEAGGGELAKVLDFGISKVREDGSGLELTRTGMVMGSPRFMAPEQAQGLPNVDHRADIYAAGGLLYTALVGAPPIAGTTLQAVFAQLLQGEIRPPSHLVPELPPALDRVVLRAMARDPANRFASAAAFREALLPFARAGAASSAELTQTTVATPAPVATSAPVVADRKGEQRALALLDGASADALVDLDEAQGLRDAPQPEGSPAPAGSASSSTPEGSIPPAVGAPAAVASAPARVAGGGGRGGPAVPAPGALRTGGGPGARVPSAVAEASGPLELDLEVARGVGSGKLPPALERVAPSRTGAPSSAARGRGGAPPRVSGVPRLAGVVGLVALLLAVGWWFAVGDEGGRAAAPVRPRVMILVETTPPNAEVYFDGVLQVTKPVELPQSELLYTVRVEAAGFAPRYVEVRANRTQTLRVSLDRIGRQLSAGSTR